MCFIEDVALKVIVSIVAYGMIVVDKATLCRTTKIFGLFRTSFFEDMRIYDTSEWPEMIEWRKLPIVPSFEWCDIVVERIMRQEVLDICCSDDGFCSKLLRH